MKELKCSFWCLKCWVLPTRYLNIQLSGYIVNIKGILNTWCNSPCPGFLWKNSLFLLEKGHTCQRENSVKSEEFLCDFVLSRGKAVCMQDVLSLLLQVFYTPLAVRSTIPFHGLLLLWIIREQFLLQWIWFDKIWYWNDITACKYFSQL